MEYHPLTSTQKSILLFQQLRHNTSIFNIGGYAVINENIKQATFFSAFEYLLKKHIALRLRIIAEKEIPVQYVSKSNGAKMDYLDFSDRLLPDEACMDWIKANFDTSLNLNESILYESALLKCTGEKYYWFLKVHHAIADGFSIALIFNDICSAYSAILENRPLKIIDNKGFIDYILSEQKYVISDKYDEDLNFWQKKMEHLPKPLKFDTEIINNSIDAAREELIFERNHFRDINEYCDRQGINIFVYFLGALYLFLSNVFLSNDFIVGIPVLNRLDSKAKKSVGPYFNILPFRMNYNKTLTAREIIQSIKTDMLSSYRHMRLPILDLIRSMDHNGNLFNTSFSNQKISYNSQFGMNESTIVFMKGNQQMNDMDIHILDFNDEWDLKVILDYKTSFISSQDAAFLLKEFKKLLCTLFQNENKRGYEITLDEERMEGLGELFFNGRY